MVQDGDHGYLQSAQGRERKQCTLGPRAFGCRKLTGNSIQKHYGKGSPDRKALEKALQSWGGMREVYAIVNGEEVRQFIALEHQDMDRCRSASIYIRSL